MLSSGESIPGQQQRGECGPETACGSDRSEGAAAVARGGDFYYMNESYGRWRFGFQIQVHDSFFIPDKLAPRAWDVARPGPKLSSHIFYAGPKYRVQLILHIKRVQYSSLYTTRLLARSSTDPVTKAHYMEVFERRASQTDMPPPPPPRHISFHHSSRPASDTCPPLSHKPSQHMSTACPLPTPSPHSSS